MKLKLSDYIDSTISVALIALAALTPLLFTTLYTNSFDIPKLIMLSVGSLVLLGLWILTWVLRGKVEISRTILDVPVLLLLLSVILSALFSSSKYASLYGVIPEVHGSLISWITYVALFFIATSHLRKVWHRNLLMSALFMSGIVISLFSILSYFKIFLPWEIAKSVNFSPAGSTFSVTAFLLLLLPVSLIYSVVSKKITLRILALSVSVLSGIAVILIGNTTFYILLFIIYFVCLAIVREHLSVSTLPFILAPIGLSFFLLIIAIVPFSGNGVNSLRKDFPQEIKLPLSISWKISASAFRDAPLVGTGPSTFQYNFTSYKPVEFNQLKYWNFSFVSAGNEFLQVLGTWGLLGFLALIILSGMVVYYCSKYVVPQKSESNIETKFLLSSLAVTGIVGVLLLLLHATSLVSIVITIMLVALFVTVQKEYHGKNSEYGPGIKVALTGNNHFDVLPVIIFVLFLAGGIFLAPKVYGAIAADYYHRAALVQASKDGAKTYEYLQKAELLNPYIDLYRADMAQTNFALANALASQKGPTAENPQGSLTDQDKQTIQTLVTQAINEGRASVVLAPRSSRNWEVLALIYRNITGIAKNSLTFALDAYGRAMQMDPMNPLLRINVGSIYHTSKNYDMAIRFYTDAVNLKPDYVNGYYNLSLALRDKGDLQNAQLVAEQAAGLLQKDMGNPDYKTAPVNVKETKVKDFQIVNDLLSEIKAKIDSGTGGSGGQTSQGSQTEPLQNPDLPSIEVPALNNPPDTISPPSVNANPAVSLPQPTTGASPIPAP